MSPNLPVGSEPATVGPAPVRPGLIHTLAAPWLCVARPRRAATTLIAARRFHFVLTYLVGALVLGLVTVGLAFWAATYEYVYLPAAAVLASAPAPRTGGIIGIWESRPLADVWGEWHRSGWWGTGETIFALTVVVALAAAATVAWVRWPSVHRIGSAWESFRRTLRAIAATLACWALIEAVVGAFIVLDDHRVLRQLAPPELVSAIGIVFVPGCLWLVLASIVRASGAAESPEPDLHLPPRCEGCGYDLTHQATSGRCSECGLPVDDSLTPRRRRPGSAWMRRPNFRTWLATAWTILCRPTRFYAALRLRTPGATEGGFAVRTYAGIFCGAVLWALANFTVLWLRDLSLTPARVWADLPLFLCRFVGVSLFGTFGCCLGHRVIGAAVATWCLSRAALPDNRWVAKIITYESAFLWVFCAFWGLMLGSFALFGDWVSQLFLPGNRWALLVPAEAWIVFFGTVVLGVFWLWRYNIAYRAVRWSNF